jgi:hypothetical protein
MYSAMPVHTTPKGYRRKPARDSSVSSLADDYTGVGTLSVRRHNKGGIVELLEPAIDGPPSPERIRALNEQVRQSQQHTTAPGSSTTSDKVLLDCYRNDTALSRNSSQRSTASSIPSRERPDSILFGKPIFNRRSRLRRDGSDFNSSSGFSFAMDTRLDANPGFRDQQTRAPMFSRLRTTKGDVEAMAGHRRLPISAPFNFQHLTHTQKDNLPNLDRASRMQLVSEFSGMRAGQKPSHGALKGIQAVDLRYNGSSSATHAQEDDHPAGLHIDTSLEPHAGSEVQQAPRCEKELPPRPTDEGSTHHLQVEDDDGYPPYRSPLSSFEPALPSTNLPPPRVSSRMSTRIDNHDSTSTTAPERPTSSDGNGSQNLDVLPEGLRAPPPYHNASGLVSSVDTRRSLYGLPAFDDASWPLGSSSMSCLPEVPEEDESVVLTRQSRMSIKSNHSSLRGSVSVPLLRQFSVAQAFPQRPSSNASETLGRFDLLAVQRALRAGWDDNEVGSFSPHETWEDDIDYCYDHAAEADCDFAWERTSIELTRTEHGLGLETVDYFITSDSSTRSDSPELLSPEVHDMPALSPASQHSNLTANEAITPTALAVPVTSNFSLPQRGHNRVLSRSSSFKESQGFTLSPSLLIPNDYHEQMLKYEREGLGDPELDSRYPAQAPQDDSSLKLDRAAMKLHARSSASTTDSRYSEQSLTSSRHKSNTSISTSYTRWTASSTCVSLDGWQAQSEQSQPSIPSIVSEEDSTSSPLPGTVVLALPEFGEPCSKLERYHERHRSEADLIGRACSEATPLTDPKSAKDAAKPRRRAKTTSRSHNGPPPQLGLFPHIPSKNARP